VEPEKIKENSAAINLAAKLAEINSIEAGFDSVTRAPDGMQVDSSQGRMVIHENGQFIWDISDPFAQLIQSDGKTLWLFDPDLEQVTIRVLDRSELSVVLLLFSGDPAAILEHYSINTADKNPDIYILEATSEKQQLPAREIRIEFSGQMPALLTTVDHYQQQLEIRFQNPEINQELEPGQFVFQLPPFADVFYE
jgi:outer membrane lipoprotein carrier protein